MSRIGKRPVLIPEGVSVTCSNEAIHVKGPKGNLSFSIPALVQVAVKDGKVFVTRKEESRFARSRQGVTQSLIQNMVSGVKQGFSKQLEIQGVGFRADVQGKNLNLSLGFSHPVAFPIPEGIQVKVANQTKISIEGCDKVLVGQIAANIRGLKPPEPYQGKGIRYLNETVRRKAGKTAAGAGAQAK